MQPPMDPTSSSTHQQPTTTKQIGDVQANNDSIGDMASSGSLQNFIFRLPYELLLIIFCHLPDPQSIIALACTHPNSAAVLRSSQLSIRNALSGNMMAGLAKLGTGYESQYLMKLYWVTESIDYQESFEAVSTILCNSWVASPKEISQAEYCLVNLPLFCQIVGELEFLGCFTQAPNLDRWHKRRFRPMARWMYKRSTEKIGAFTYKTPPKFKNIELLMVVNLWCGYYWESRPYWPNVPIPTAATFLSKFTQETAQRARQFAQCYMEGKKETVRTERNLMSP
ncbi:hypothetical protein CHU98_g3551 [Xylaria longipes]|nr:hypothetical protein CHU98_g3551 [Xylaria longipes]